MNTKKVGRAAGAVATLGVALVGGNAIAGAAASSGSYAVDGAARAAYGYGAPGGDDGPGLGDPGGHDHTPVTGAELTRVKNAVTAEDPEVTVETVRQDPDGSYDVLGTRDGAPVMLEVSADLATVTENDGGGHLGGPGDRGVPEAEDAGPSESTSQTGFLQS